jgi:hypothetical protein
MKARKAAAAVAAPAFVVRAARGYQRPDGGVVFSGMIYRGDEQVTSFHNEGNGGCNSYQIRNFELFAEFKAAAVAEFPASKFEQEDLLAGQLWDAAYLKGAA